MKLLTYPPRVQSVASGAGWDLASRVSRLKRKSNPLLGRVRNPLLRCVRNGVIVHLKTRILAHRGQRDVIVPTSA